MTLMQEIELNAKEALDVLSPRERVALQHLSNGDNRRKTAVAMLVKRETVKKYWQTSREKLRAAMPQDLQRKFGALLNNASSARREVRAGSLSECVGY